MVSRACSKPVKEWSDEELTVGLAIAAHELSRILNVGGEGSTESTTLTMAMLVDLNLEVWRRGIDLRAPEAEWRRVGRRASVVVPLATRGPFGAA